MEYDLDATQISIRLVISWLSLSALACVRPCAMSEERSDAVAFRHCQFIALIMWQIKLRLI